MSINERSVVRTNKCHSCSKNLFYRVNNRLLVNALVTVLWEKYRYEYENF